MQSASNLFFSFISLLSFVGFSICLYIYKKKGKGEHLVCPIGSNCNDVIYSHYAKTFGLRNEVGGMIYYIFIFLINGSVLFNIKIPLQIMAFSIFSSFIAFLFSIYLICIQAFVIRKWCTWCVASAFISTFIFLISIFKFIV